VFRGLNSLLVVQVIFPDQDAFRKKTGRQSTHSMPGIEKRLLYRGDFTGKLTVEARMPQTQMTLKP
jgi:hypothetical protein